jgi:hypothetical protein
MLGRRKRRPEPIPADFLAEECLACLQAEVLRGSEPAAHRFRAHYEALHEDGGMFRSLRHSVLIRRGNRRALCGYLVPVRER